MKNFLFFLILIFAALLDASFFSRFSFFGIPAILSAALAAGLAFYSKKTQNVFWMAAPAAVFRIFSRHSFLFLLCFFSGIYCASLMLAKKAAYFKKQNGIKPI